MMRLTTLLFASFLAAFSLPAPAQAPLKLGLLLDMSGPYADLGGQGSVTAARMAVDDFGGKVLGRPIEIVFADHQNKPDTRRLACPAMVRRPGRRGNPGCRRVGARARRERNRKAAQ